jgi:PAS domain S-box-containing protein
MLRSEERFRKLFDSNTIGIAIADLNGNTLEANDAYLDMLGVTGEEVLAGKVNWSEMTPADYAGPESPLPGKRRFSARTAPVFPS